MVSFHPWSSINILPTVSKIQTSLAGSSNLSCEPSSLSPVRNRKVPFLGMLCLPASDLLFPREKAYWPTTIAGFLHSLPGWWNDLVSFWGAECGPHPNPKQPGRNSWCWCNKAWVNGKCRYKCCYPQAVFLVVVGVYCSSQPRPHPSFSSSLSITSIVFSLTLLRENSHT